MEQEYEHAERVNDADNSFFSAIHHLWAQTAVIIIFSVEITTIIMMLID